MASFKLNSAKCNVKEKSVVFKEQVSEKKTGQYINVEKETRAAVL